MSKRHYQEIRQTIVQKDPDDPKRDRRKCTYFEDGYCMFNFQNCNGSAFCKNYKLPQINDDEENEAASKSREKLRIKQRKTFEKLYNVKSPCVIIKMSHERYTQLFNTEKLEYIDLELKGVNKFREYSYFSDYLFYIETEAETILVDDVIYERNIQRQGDLLSLKLKIRGMKPNRSYGSKVTTLWTASDLVYGEIIFKGKPRNY